MNNQTITKSFETILEMLNDRKEDIGDISKGHIEEILKKDNIKQVIEIIINDIKIVYYTPSKFKWSEVKKYFEDEKPYKLYILVIQESITQYNMKSISASSVNIEIHPINRLQFNITKHILVPKHEVIKDKDEIDNVLKMYRLETKSKLPIILKSDPVAKYFGLKPGEIVKITRISETAGEYIMYRVCM